MRKHQAGGFTLIELLMVVAIIGVIAAIAIPSLFRSRQSANEASAIASMRSISSAQSAYAASCGYGYYARTLEGLAVAPGGGAPFVGPDLSRTNIVKSSYTVTMASDNAAPGSVPPACNGQPLGTGYHATAVPLSGAGTREFGTNTTGVIFFVELPATLVVSDLAVSSGTALK
jgi:type IV pilus assembly protein PilA